MNFIGIIRTTRHKVYKELFCWCSDLINNTNVSTAGIARWFHFRNKKTGLELSVCLECLHIVFWLHTLFFCVFYIVEFVHIVCYHPHVTNISLLTFLLMAIWHSTICICLIYLMVIFSIHYKIMQWLISLQPIVA